MIEPTETRVRETVDAFIDAMRSIDLEISEDPELVKGAPHSTPWQGWTKHGPLATPVLRVRIYCR